MADFTPFSAGPTPEAVLARYARAKARRAAWDPVWRYTIYAREPRTEVGEERTFLDGFRRLELPLVDERGRSRWPERFDDAAIAELQRRHRPNKYHSQMLLRPVNIAAGRLDPDRLRLYTAELDYAERNGVATLALDGREMVSATCWWDPAFGGAAEGRRRDNSVVAAVFTDRDGGYWLHRIRYLAVDTRSETDEATQQCRQVAEFLRVLYAPAIVVETNGVGRFLPGLLRRELAEAGVGCAVVESASRKPKDQRILEAFDAVLAARGLAAHRSVWDTPFVMEMREWRPGGDGYKGPDDGLDAVAGCISSEPVRLKHGPAPPRRPWRSPPGGVSAVTEFEI